MAAPGVTVTVSSAPASSSNPAPTGTALIVGQTERGQVGVPITIQSMADYAARLGQRVSYGALYDWLDVFFKEGGNTALVSRCVGPTAVAASVVLKDRAGVPVNTLTVTALGPGIWGNTLSVNVINGTLANTFQIQIVRGGAVVETSSVCASPADAVNWSANSAYVTITDAGSATAAPNNNPAVISNAPLAAGTDDTAVTDAIRTTALAVFDPSYGPGQVAAPAITSAATHTALMNHAAANNRVAVLDGVNTATASTLTGAASTDQAAATDPSYSVTVGTWLSYPGVPTGTATPAFPRTIPGSAAFCGLCARNDAVNDANTAAAGQNGILRAALNVAQTFNASDRSLLEAAGVLVFRNIPTQGGIQAYGQTSMAADPTWSDLANVRFRMQLVYEGQVIGGQFVFGQIDGKGQMISAFNGALVAALTKHWAKGSLYGATPKDAFVVNTGSSVNTPTTIAARQLNAVESVRMSPSAPTVDISIVKYAVTQPVA